MPFVSVFWLGIDEVIRLVYARWSNQNQFYDIIAAYKAESQKVGSADGVGLSLNCMEGFTVLPAFISLLLSLCIFYRVDFPFVPFQRFEQV